VADMDIQPQAQGRNPPWSRDELILALDLYMTNPSSPPSKISREVGELSDVLNDLGSQLSGNRQATYRNPNGVYMKMMNFRRFDPDFAAQGRVGLTRGNRLEEEVWNEFASDRDRLRSVAASIKATLRSTELRKEAFAAQDDVEEAEEGRLLTRLHRTRERNRKLVDTRKRQALEAHGTLACEACGFDFEKTYGERGRGYIEAHHTKPVHTLAEGGKTRLEDLALLCANCHRMVHARRPWLTIERLKLIQRK
jgi:5-methylcytosine-specific restriction enzyme A